MVRRLSAVSSLIAIATFVLLIPAPEAAAQGRGHGYGKNHGGSSNFFGLGPGGFTYGYSDKNFGLLIGPVGGGVGYGGYGNGGHYHSRGSFYDGAAYRDPVYDAPVVINSSRSQPARSEVLPAPPANNAPVIIATPEAEAFSIPAEQAFRAHDYEEAARLIRHAIVEDVRNGELHIFNSQILFAIGDYEGALAALGAATQLLNEADWGFLVENFRLFYNNGDYVAQMDRLVNFNKANPRSATPRVLRGYHYLYLGHKDSARKQFEKALELEPSHPLALRFLATITEKVPAPRPVPEARENGSSSENTSGGTVD